MSDRYTLLQSQNVDGEATWTLYDTILKIAIGHKPMTDKAVAEATRDALNFK